MPTSHYGCKKKLCAWDHPARIFILTSIENPIYPTWTGLDWCQDRFMFEFISMYITSLLSKFSPGPNLPHCKPDPFPWFWTRPSPEFSKIWPRDPFFFFFLVAQYGPGCPAHLYCVVTSLLVSWKHNIKGALDNILKFYFWLNFIYHIKCNC